MVKMDKWEYGKKYGFFKEVEEPRIRRLNGSPKKKPITKVKADDNRKS